MRCIHACDAKCTIDSLHFRNTGIVLPRFPSILRFNAVKVLTRGKSQVEWHENQKRSGKCSNAQYIVINARVSRRMSFIEFSRGEIICTQCTTLRHPANYASLSCVKQFNVKIIDFLHHTIKEIITHVKLASQYLKKE